MEFSERIASVKPSATLGLTSKAKAMRQAGEDVVMLAAGEPDFDTPQIAKEAAINAIRDGYTKYTPVGGAKSLKEAISDKLEGDNGLVYGTDEIVVSNGAKHSLYNVLQVICKPGDEVLIISPYWVSYPEMVKLAGGEPKTISTSIENGFRATADDIRKSITKKTRALIINSPSNPAGVVYDEKELCEIANVCVENSVMIISDEIYEKIIFDGRKHFSVAAISDEVRALTVLVNGLSKSHSMTGWRVGYLACDSRIVSAVTTLQGHSTSNPCSISQAAAECALRSDLEEEMARNRGEFQRRRDFLVESFAKEEKVNPFIPGGAFYLFCDISGCGLDSLTFADRLLDETKVAVIPGGPFGEDGYVRMSFTTDMKTLEEGVGRIKEWVGKI